MDLYYVKEGYIIESSRVGRREDREGKTKTKAQITSVPVLGKAINNENTFFLFCYFAFYATLLKMNALVQNL